MKHLKKSAVPAADIYKLLYISLLQDPGSQPVVMVPVTVPVYERARMAIKIFFGFLFIIHIANPLSCLYRYPPGHPDLCLPVSGSCIPHPRPIHPDSQNENRAGSKSIESCSVKSS